MKTSIRVALISLLWLVAINSGQLGTLDTNLRSQMAHAWWTGAEEVQVKPDMEPKVRGDIRFGVVGADGERRIAYETGQSFLMLPADWLGSQVHELWPVASEQVLRRWAINLFTFIPINVAVVLAAFWLLKLFQFESRTAGLASLTLLLGTTVLHYSQVHQHNNQLLLFTTLGYATAIAYTHSKRALWLVAGGVALGLAVFIRVTSVIHVLTVLLFLTGIIAHRYRQIRPVVQAVALWLVGFVPVFLVSRYVDFLRFGSFFASGKGVEKLQLETDPMWVGLPQLPEGYPLTNQPHIGILGPLFSPAKSIFLYDPLLLPCLVIGILAWRKLSPWLQWYLVTAALNLGLHLAIYSRFVFWHGDSAWGARYHVTSVHLLLIPLLAIFIQQLLTAKRAKRFLYRGLLIVALIAQLSSVAMPMNLEIFQKKVGMPGTRLEFRLGHRISNIACQIDRDLSKLCIDRNPDKKAYVEQFNHWNFFPFIYSKTNAETGKSSYLQVSLFLLWGLALGSAILASIYTWRLNKL